MLNALIRMKLRIQEMRKTGHEKDCSLYYYQERHRSVALASKQLSCIMSENQHFAYAKAKTQISCAVTAQLINAFVFTT